MLILEGVVVIPLNIVRFEYSPLVIIVDVVRILADPLRARGIISSVNLYEGHGMRRTGDAVRS